MVKKFFKGDRKYFFILSIMFILSIILLVVSFLNFNFNKLPSYSDITDSFVSDNKSVDVSNLKDYDYIETTLPNIEYDTNLFFNVKGTNISVYIDGLNVYEADYSKPELGGKVKGLYYVNIPLSKDDSGKILKIELNNIYKDNSPSIEYIRIGDYVPILEIRKMLVPFVISCFILFIGLFIIILFPFLWKKGLTSAKTLFLGLFVLAIGCFLTCDSNLLQIIFGKEGFFHTASELFMQLACIPFVLFISRIYNCDNKKVYKLICFISFVIFIFTFNLFIFDIKDFHQTVDVVHIEYLFFFIYSLYLIFKSFNKKDRLLKIHTIALMSVVFLILFDVLIYYSGFYYGTSYGARIGIVIFIALEIYIIAEEYLSKYKNLMKTELLNKLAYNDGLTELYNRTSFMEDMQTNRNCGYIIVFDVNNLKYVNDNLGHSFGDELIITVSNYIKEYFSNIGKCYRIGGDEFVVISNDKITKKDIDNNYKMLCDALDYININEKRKYYLSIAMGCQDISKTKSMDEAFNKADSMMYKNKIKMKKELSNSGKR